MRAHATPISGLMVLEPSVFSDERGHFRETWNARRYAALGIEGAFAQDNVSISKRGVIRGLHFQNPHPQGKLISVLSGALFDVAVDIRWRSSTFGQWFGIELSARNGLQLWIPSGFAHGFQALRRGTICSYKCTSYYSPAHEHSLRWDDPAVGIEWPLKNPIVSAKDAAALTLSETREDYLFGKASPGSAAEMDR